MDCSLPGSSVHGFLQDKNTGCHALLQEMEPEFLKSPKLAGRFFTTSATWETPKDMALILNQEKPRKQFKQRNVKI